MKFMVVEVGWSSWTTAGVMGVAVKTVERAERAGEGVYVRW